MGDRANILIKDTNKDRGVYLYTHWRGTELPDDLQTALKKKWRWNDTPYLARIIFCQMIPPNKINEETGFGISDFIADGGDRILEIDVEKQTISRKEKKWTFDEYTQLSKKEIEEVWK